MVDGAFGGRAEVWFVKLGWQPITLDLRRPWQIAPGVSHCRHNVLVHLETGVGEAAAVSYHGETQAGISDYLRKVDLKAVEDPFRIEDILRELPAGSAAARAAIDIALHDLCGQLVGQPLYRLLGLNPARIPPTSFTIAIDTPEATARLATDAAGPILKIKLGAADDEARMKSVRQATSATLRVDANGGWTREQARALLPILADYDVELVEQPLPVGDLDGLRDLMSVRPRPRLFVDESIRTVRDIQAHAELVDGVVIKLAKCGGIREALRQITIARALEMDVMIGCMIETSVAVTAAAHLAPLAQYVDLDGPLLISNDPMRGVRYEDARLILPTGPGLGLVAQPLPSA
jgi:L-alanine-DL-glutamate epimerase-like enolase superfamily enzyme